MNRLQSELQRLYRPAHFAVLELARPADWQRLSTVWRGVQADLDLPAPAIAVNGVDGFQLWFALAEPQPEAQVLAFLDALRLRYLGDIAPARIGVMVAAEATEAAEAAEAAEAVWATPPRQMQGEQWSAFIAADLAPVFTAEPWLDTAPSPDGQADLLARLTAIKPADLQAALARLGMAKLGPAPPGISPLDQPPQPACPPAAPVLPALPTLPDSDLDPRRFLQDVLNDTTVAWALRIEAAKALLPGVMPPGKP